MKKTVSQALNLGVLQSELEAATKAHKSAISALQKAEKAAAEAESRYVASQKTFTAAVEQLRQATKVL